MCAIPPKQEEPRAPVSVAEISTPDLVDMLPTHKITKSRGQKVDVQRSPFETLVIEELWARHAKNLYRNLKAAVLAPGSTLCPLQEPDKLFFIDESLTRSRDALTRLTVRGDFTERGGYDNFEGYLWRVTLNKALDLRRQYTGERSGGQRQVGAPIHGGTQQKGSSEAMETVHKPVLMSLTDAKDVTGAPDPESKACVLDARRIIEAYCREAPENAVSFRTVFQKEVEGWTWEEMAERVPSALSLEARIQQIRRFTEKDKRELLNRLKPCVQLQ